MSRSAELLQMAGSWQGEVRKQWLAVRDQVNALEAAQDNVGARDLVAKQFAPISLEYVRVTQTLVEGEVAQVQAAEQVASAMFKQLYLIGGVFLAFAVAVAVFISWRLSRGIKLGLSAATLAMQPLATATCVSIRARYATMKTACCSRRLTPCRATTT